MNSWSRGVGGDARGRCEERSEEVQAVEVVADQGE